MALGSSARARSVALAVTLVVATGTALFASSHIRLVNEGSSGSLYECGASACAPAQTDNPSRKNLDQMDFYVLPDGCVSLASAVLRPDSPGVDVECGPPGDSRRYRCEAGSCLPLDPGAIDDPAVARTIPLPADCGGRIHELIVVGATTETPAVFVECDGSSGRAREF